MKYRLLIVDDEELIRRGLCARINSFGLSDLEIDEAGSGGAALEEFGRNRVDIALVDISMPDMSGLEMIEKARQISPDTIFIVLSGYAEFAYAQRAIQLRVHAYLNKPVANEMLRSQLESAIQELENARQPGGDAGDRAAFDPEKELNILLSGEMHDSRPEDACPGLYRRFPRLLDGTGRLYLAVVHLGRKDDGAEGLFRSRMNEIRQEVRSIFEKTACGCEKLVADSYQNAQRLCVLFMSERGKNLRSDVERFFLAVQPELERVSDVRVTMGVSHMASHLGAECVGNARVALRQRYVQGRSNIYFYEDVSEMEHESFPEAELELLRKCMERQDRPGVHRQLKRLLSGDLMEKRRAVYLHVLWVRVAGMVMRMYNDMDSAMINRLLSQTARMETIAEGNVAGMLAELIDDCMKLGSGREMNTAEKISYATNYIREHYNEEIVINDLAAKLDMSPGYFSSVFKKEAGQSTMQYVTGLRVEKAKAYLADSDLSVAAIAKNIGYADSQYFYRVFKRTTGMTPLQYRQENRGE